MHGVPQFKRPFIDDPAMLISLIPQLLLLSHQPHHTRTRTSQYAEMPERRE
jgi:hypothetical protein